MKIIKPVLISLFLCLSAYLHAQADFLTEPIISLVQPIQLGASSTELITEDYFTDPAKITAVSTNAATISATLSPDKKKIVLTTEGEVPYLSALRISVGKRIYTFLLKKYQKQFTRFVFKEFPGKSPDKVILKGSFNNWSPESNPMRRNAGTGEWVAELWLDAGTHVYKYEVDGREILDPYNADQIPNGLGGTNSVIYLKATDAKLLPSISLTSANVKTSTISISCKSPGTINSDNIFALWQNTRLKTTLKGGRISFIIPSEAVKHERSSIRVYLMNERGAGNDLLIPLKFGKVVRNSSQLSRQDWESMIMYFTVVDRFNNGNSTNDKPLIDDRLKPIQNYYGGDIKGISNKIKEGYFKKLGINTIWLSPITQNPWEAYQEYPEPRRWYSGYHGYWPTYTTAIDKRFGNEKELDELVQTAHDNGMNLLLDYVCHHVHISNKMYQDHKDWVTPLHLPDGRTNIRIWDEQRLTTWFDDFLPTLDLAKEEVANIQSDSALFWIKRYNIDGFRHDATKHVPTSFWRMLTKKMKQEVILPNKRMVYQIGETFGNNELISSYLGNGLLDAQFNFNLYFDTRDQFASDKTDLTVLSNSLRQSFSYFGYNNTMGNITGNHDLTRFMGLASKAVKFDEDPKEAGYKRDIEIIDSSAYDKLQSMTAFIMTIPGIPIVYYGDEIGMVGAGDPDNRRPMRFSGLNNREQTTKEVCARLAALRKNHMALLFGNFNILKSEKEALVYSRDYLNDHVWIAFNTSDKDYTVELNVPTNKQAKIESFSKTKAQLKDGKLVFSIPSHGFDIMYLK